MLNCMLEHLIVAATVCLYFLIQGVCLASLAVLLKKYSNLEWLECAVGSLALHQILKISLMAGTSFFHTLSHTYAALYGLAVFLLIFAAFVAAFRDTTFRSSFPGLKFESIFKDTSIPFFICGGLFVAFFLLVLVRAVYFFDNIFDVEGYGYSKIAFYFQNNSIFHITGLRDLRIDSFERNGELNFLHAFLITRDIRFFGLAGVEVWIGIILSTFFLLRSLEVGRMISLVYAFLLGSAPAVYGLSSITKGDSWSAMYFVLAVGFLVLIRNKGFCDARFFFFVVFLALAAASKLSMAFAVVLFLPLGLWISLKDAEFQFKPVAWILTILAGLCISNKQLQNIFVYGNPFQQDEWSKEHGGFALENLIASLPKVFDWIWGLQGDLIPLGHQNDSLKGFGLVFWILLFLVLFCIFQKRFASQIPRSKFLEGGLVVLMALATGLAFAAYVKTGHFDLYCRFLLPHFLVIACFCIAGIFFPFSKSPRFSMLVMIACSLAMAFHWFGALKTSTTLTHRGKWDMLDRIVNYDRFQSRFGLDFAPGPEAVELYKSKSGQPVRMLVYTLDYFATYSWVFGDNFAWQTTVTDQREKFLELLQNGNFDYFCVAHFRNTQAETLEKEIQLASPAFKTISKHEWANLYQP
jgi:hypothetical protein